MIDRLRQQIKRIGPHFRRVLVSGEAGSRRESVARALWAASPGAARPFVVLSHRALEDAAALSRHDARIGNAALQRYVRSALEGMLWIDDVSVLSIAAQALLLRLLEEPTCNGENLRIAVGTAITLKAQAAAGTCSQELRLALTSIELQLPPLREHIEDLPALVHEAVHSIAREYDLPVQGIASEVLDKLGEYSWPGNETELEDVLRAAVLTCDSGHLKLEHLPLLKQPCIGQDTQSKEPDRLQVVIDRHLLRVLSSCDGNKQRAAERLGISRSTLYRMLETCVRPQRAL